ncbi:MAG: methyltransferase [Paenibacillus sp.]|jgi:ubiquinone/menaquinone biosynthesis C-methylase UbiE|nr:methyltransferase [Paenibacillus sp.]
MSDMIDYYSGFDEWGRLDREPLEFQVNWHFIKSHLPSAGAVLDNGAGPGKYAIELAKLGYNVTLTDITPRLVDVAREKAAELGLLDRFSGFRVRNATDLAGLPDETFDASLMLGPLYHLQQEADRVQAVRELHRVTKPGGTVFAAVRPRSRKVLTALMSPAFWKPLDSIAAIRKFQQDGMFDHADRGRFTGAYFFQVADICPFFESNGFETVKLISSTGLGGRLTKEHWDYWSARGETEQLMELIYESAEDPYALGATASHLLYIGKRKDRA